MKFLVLATGTPSRHLIKALEGHKYEHHSPSDLYLYVSESVNGYDRMYNGNPGLAIPERLKAREYDAVISRLGSNLSFGATILQHLNENLGIYCPQSGAGLLVAQDKMKTVMRLSAAGIRVPLTVFAQNASHVDFIMGKLGGLPVIAKLLKGSQGVGVMICKDQEQTNTTLESFWGHDIDVMLQRFIDSERKDVRAIVVGEKVVVAMQRTGAKDFRANISQGGSGVKVTLSKEQEEMCVKSSKVLGLEFAGVDIMTDKDGRSYVIEVNGNPGTKIIDITGHNYFVDLVKHMEAKMRKIANTLTAVDKNVPIADENENEASHIGQDYRDLLAKEKLGTLNYNESARLTYFKSRKPLTTY